MVDKHAFAANRAIQLHFKRLLQACLVEHMLLVALELRDSVIRAEVLQAYGARENVFLIVMQATVRICLELGLHQLGHVLLDVSLGLLRGHL